ncbi:MAG TPA: hypothetical protein VI072_13620, partial [Polyangiaceae bacterium]
MGNSGAVLLVLATLVGCARSNASAPAQRDAAGSTTAQPTPRSGPAEPKADAAAVSASRVLRFAWRPPGGSAAEYETLDVADGHRVVLPPGTTRGRAYPVVIALHGQPKREQAPRHYRFTEVVTRVAQSLWTRGDSAQFVLALPAFRFTGANWPAFDLVLFKKELERELAAEGVQASRYYVVGHSAAAGCGGLGMNGAHRLEPAAVGFFDTCVGAGFRSEVRALRKAGIPTLLAYSVETAGFRPRPPREYMTSFDFGKVFAPLGLAPSDCPARLPDAPLRPQPFRCASDSSGVVRAFVLDTGEGEAGHNAVVPVA